MTSTPLSGAELRDRVKALKLTYREAAEHLGLTLDGLNKQMSGARPVSRQTELLLGYVERALASQAVPAASRSRRVPAPWEKRPQPVMQVRVYPAPWDGGPGPKRR
jgi:hypothetical protein